ncbi:Hypothetical predicted protein, partial [Marmota monax]
MACGHVEPTMQVRPEALQASEHQQLGLGTVRTTAAEAHSTQPCNRKLNLPFLDLWTQGRPQRQPWAAASGAGAGTAGGGGGGAEESKMSTEAQRVDDSPSTSGGSSDGDQRESVQQEPEREQVQPKKKEGKISSKTAAKLSTSAKRIQKELAEITLDPPPNC